jgi:hypothetical protein
VLLAVPVAASVKIVAGHFWRTRVLGQSWEQATDALIVEPEPRESLISRVRRSRASSGKEEDADSGEEAAREPEPEDTPLDG